MGPGARAAWAKNVARAEARATFFAFSPGAPRGRPKSYLILRFYTKPGGHKKLVPGTPGAPGDAKITPGDPRDHLKKYEKF